MKSGDDTAELNARLDRLLASIKQTRCKMCADRVKLMMAARTRRGPVVYVSCESCAAVSVLEG